MLNTPPAWWGTGSSVLSVYSRCPGCGLKQGRPAAVFTALGTKHIRIGFTDRKGVVQVVDLLPFPVDAPLLVKPRRAATDCERCGSGTAEAVVGLLAGRLPQAVLSHVLAPLLAAPVEAEYICAANA